MCKSRLKNFDKYLQSIELYAEASGIKIEYSAKDDEGAYIPSRRKVRVDPDLSPTFELAVLLHELGHALDTFIAEKKHEQRIENAYRAFYHGKPTKAHKSLVWACETRAWEYGKAIAKKLRIPLGKWYAEVQKYCLESYK